MKPGIAIAPEDLVAPGVRRIRIPVPVPTIRWVNVFLVEGPSGWTLVDTGFRSEEADALVASVLAAAGISVREIERAFITHRHPDHLGMAEALAARGVELVMHGPELDALRRAALVTQEHAVQLNVLWFEAHGMPSSRVGQLRASMGYRPQTPAPVISVADGQTIDLGGRRMRVLWTPGHTDHHAVLIDEGERLLFSGDHVLPRGTSNVMLAPDTEADDPLGAYLDSLRALRGLPIRRLLAGHGDPMDDLPGRVDELLSHHADRLERTLAALGDAARDAYTLARPFVGRSGTMWAERVALGETLAHLRHLERQGLVEKIDGQIAMWRAAPGPGVRSVPSRVDPAGRGD